MSSADCPSRDVLFAYQTGELSEALAESLTSHVVCCEACQAGLNTIREAEDTFVARLRASATEDPYLQEAECAGVVARVKATAGSLAMSAASAVAAGSAPPVLGRLGEYELLDKLGEGGMGAVYRARQVNLDRVVALKVLPRGRAEGEHAVARFYREMKAVGRLNHPNIVE